MLIRLINPFTLTWFASWALIYSSDYLKRLQIHVCCSSSLQAVVLMSRGFWAPFKTGQSQRRGEVNVRLIQVLRDNFLQDFGDCAKRYDRWGMCWTRRWAHSWITLGLVFLLQERLMTRIKIVNFIEIYKFL